MAVLLTRKQETGSHTNQETKNDINTNQETKNWHKYSPGNKKPTEILTRKQKPDSNTNQETKKGQKY